MSRRAKVEEKSKVNKKSIIIAVVVLLLIIFISPFVWYSIAISPVDRNNDEAIQIEIPEGTPGRQIAGILRENEVIRSEMAFNIYVWLSGDVSFQAGTYYLKQSMSLSDIISHLQTGIVQDPNQIQLRFTEGRNMRWLAREIEKVTNNTAEDVFALLADEEYISSLVERFWFLTDEIKHNDIFYPLEGYLFPDTYTLRGVDVTVEEIFERMLVRMEEILSEYRSEIEASEFTVHEIITIGSILETESLGGEGARNVSSIIYNRLERNMALEMDPTTYYAVGLEKGERQLRVSELATPSPYNTRGPNMEGRLPIGPIASVSRGNIEAALRPNDTNYLFFVSDKNGRLYFRETYEAHNRIIRELRESGMWYMHGN